MNKILFVVVVLLVVVLCWDSPEAFQDATKPFTFVARDTIKATKLNANWDTLYTRANDLYDSLDIKFLRFTDFRDSTIDSIKTNRIMSNPSIDSIQGLNVLRGNPNIDSISGLNVLRGNPDIDSMQGLNVIRGNPDIDSISGNTEFTGTINVDSITKKGYPLIVSEYSSVSCSLYTGSTYKKSGIAKIVQNGDVVTLMLPLLLDTLGSSAATTIRGNFPRTSDVDYYPFTIQTNDTIQSGLLVWGANLTLTKINNGYLDAGYGGIPYRTQVTYHTK